MTDERDRTVTIRGVREGIDCCAHGALPDRDDGFRFIQVGAVRLEERIFKIVGDGALVDVNNGAIALSTTLSATELAYLARQLCGWFTNPDEDVKTATARIDKVAAALEAWNARAREDEEHPPYEDLTAHLRAAHDSLERLRVMFGTDETIRDPIGLTRDRAERAKPEVNDGVPVRDLETLHVPTLDGELLAIRAGQGVSFYIAGMRDGRLVWNRVTETIEAAR